MNQLRTKLHPTRTAWCYVLLTMFFGCVEPETPNAFDQTAPVDTGGPFSVGNTTVTLNDQARDRALTVEIWYPTSEMNAAMASPMDFEDEAQAREVLASAYAEAPSECLSPVTQSHPNGQAIHTAEGLPMVLFSHCMNCGRYSSFSLTERLASHGMVVVSVDHAGNLPFFASETKESLSITQLNTRVADLRFVFERSLDQTLFEQSDAIAHLTINSTRIGVFGHSFGSVTAATFAVDEPAVVAVAGLAAPMENPLFRNLEMADLTIPIFLLLAQEDNSIQEFGNTLIRSNFDAAVSPTWLVSIADAGHWSVSDLCGLTDAFAPGCGEGVRHSSQDTGSTFTYLPVRDAIAITQNYLTAFFLGHLSARTDAVEYLNASPSDSRISVQRNSKTQ